MNPHIDVENHYVYTGLPSVTRRLATSMRDNDTISIWLWLASSEFLRLESGLYVLSFPESTWKASVTRGRRQSLVDSGNLGKIN